MSEEENKSASQFQLGQLFIDIGSKGLGGLVKGLNTLSAQFLLTKNAAVQAIKPITNLSKNAVSEIANYDKLHSVMGIAVKDLQRYKVAAQTIGIEPQMLFSQMQNVQQQILRIKAGLDSSGIQGFALLGIDPRTLNQNDPIDVLNKIGKKLNEVDEATRTTVLGLLGWSEELAYYFDRVSVAFDEQNSKFNENLLLNDKELENLRDQQNAWNLLKTTWDSAQQKFIANQTWINSILAETTKMISDLTNSWFDWEQGIEQSQLYKFLARIGQFAGEVIVRGKGIGETAKITDLNKVAAAMSDKTNSENQEIIKRYEAIKTLQSTLLQRDKNNFLAAKSAPNQEKSGTRENLIKVVPISEEYPKMPPLPSSAAPISPTAYLPETVQNSISNKDVKFEIINNNELNIQTIPGADGEQIGQDIVNAITRKSLLPIYNRELPNV